MRTLKPRDKVKGPDILIKLEAPPTPVGYLRILKNSPSGGRSLKMWGTGW